MQKKQIIKTKKKNTAPKISTTSGDLKNFNITLHENIADSLGYVRNDYYTLVLTTGNLWVKQGKKKYKILQPALFLRTANQELQFEESYKGEGSFICLFNTSFLTKEGVQIMHKIGDKRKKNNLPFILLNEDSYSFFLHYYKLIFEEYHSKEDSAGLIQQSLTLMLKRMLLLKEENPMGKRPDKPDLALEFYHLLNNQFPVTSPSSEVSMSTPKDFAAYFDVHINYLNAALKKKYQQTTTKLIQEKIAKEAEQLLKHTDWTVSQIGKALGFSYPQHFNVFFKKCFGVSPKKFRDQATSKA